LVLSLRRDACRWLAARLQSKPEAPDARSRRVTIIANIGYQQGDLDGEHATRPFKLPNPFYYIASHRAAER
jgi:hypothetical protein